MTLNNLGPRSREMLAAAGITDLAALKTLGAVSAFASVRTVDRRASLNLLWALHGAITGRHWQDVAREDRAALLAELESLEGGSPLLD